MDSSTPAVPVIAWERNALKGPKYNSPFLINVNQIAMDKESQSSNSKNMNI